MKLFAVKPEDIIMSCSGTIGKLSKIPKNYKKELLIKHLLDSEQILTLLANFSHLYEK